MASKATSQSGEKTPSLDLGKTKHRDCPHLLWGLSSSGNELYSSGLDRREEREEVCDEDLLGKKVQEV